MWLDWIVWVLCSGELGGMAVVNIPRGFCFMKDWRVWRLFSAWMARRYILFSVSQSVGSGKMIE